jgi:hypothetical protein
MDVLVDYQSVGSAHQVVHAAVRRRCACCRLCATNAQTLLLPAWIDYSPPGIHESRAEAPRYN